MISRVHELHTDVRVFVRFRSREYARLRLRKTPAPAGCNRLIAGLSDFPTRPPVVLRLSFALVRARGAFIAGAACPIREIYSAKGIAKGTGLGLAMIHGLAAQLGGMLEVSSARSR